MKTHTLLCPVCEEHQDWESYNAGDNCPNCGEALLVLFNIVEIPRERRSKLISYAYNGGTQFRYNFDIDGIDTGNHIIIDKAGKIWHGELIGIPVEEFVNLLCQVIEHLSTAEVPHERNESESQKQ